MVLMKQLTYLCTGSWCDDFNDFWCLVVDGGGLRVGLGVWLGRRRSEHCREREYRYYVH